MLKDSTSTCLENPSEYSIFFLTHEETCAYWSGRRFPCQNLSCKPEASKDSVWTGLGFQKNAEINSHRGLLTPENRCTWLNNHVDAVCGTTTLHPPMDDGLWWYTWLWNAVYQMNHVWFMYLGLPGNFLEIDWTGAGLWQLMVPGETNRYLGKMPARLPTSAVNREFSFLQRDLSHCCSMHSFSWTTTAL